MVASVPTRGVRTIHALVGDLLARLSLAGLVALLGVGCSPPEWRSGMGTTRDHMSRTHGR